VDHAVLHSLNHLFVAHDGLEDAVVAYVNVSELLFLVLLGVLLLLPTGRRAAVAAGLSAGLALAVGQVISRLVDRPRPFVTHPAAVHEFGRHAADAGFPSDHATAAFAIAVALVLRRPRWGAVALVLAVVLSAGRVAMGIHYPSDVLAGAALGAAVALAGWTPPLRHRVDALADAGGRRLDALMRRPRPAA
jgi:undecaprenyl-diphosphatase